VEIASTVTANIALFATACAGARNHLKSGRGRSRPLTFRVVFLFEPTPERRHFLHRDLVPYMVFLVQLSYGLGHGP